VFPLNIDLHDGIDEIKALKNDSSGQVTSETLPRENCIVKMIQMVGTYVKSTSEPVIFLLDAYFPSISSFNSVEAINCEGLHYLLSKKQ
jgi:hypothetical protein